MTFQAVPTQYYEMGRDVAEAVGNIGRGQVKKAVGTYSAIKGAESQAIAVSEMRKKIEEAEQNKEKFKELQNTLLENIDKGFDDSVPASERVKLKQRIASFTEPRQTENMLDVISRAGQAYITIKELKRKDPDLVTPMSLSYAATNDAAMEKFMGTLQKCVKEKALGKKTSKARGEIMSILQTKEQEKGKPLTKEEAEKAIPAEYSNPIYKDVTEQIKQGYRPAKEYEMADYYKAQSAASAQRASQAGKAANDRAKSVIKNLQTDVQKAFKGAEKYLTLSGSGIAGEAKEPAVAMWERAVLAEKIARAMAEKGVELGVEEEEKARRIAGDLQDGNVEGDEGVDLGLDYVSIYREMLAEKEASKQQKQQVKEPEDEQAWLSKIFGGSKTYAEPESRNYGPQSTKRPSPTKITTEQEYDALDPDRAKEIDDILFGG